MIKRRLPFAAAAAALLALTLAGCGAAKTAAAPASTATATATASPTPSRTPSGREVNQVECVNLTRAYNAWETLDTPTTTQDVAGMNEGAIKYAMDDGKTFLDAVSGYDDQPSKQLAVAIAGYNFELSVANVQNTMSDKIEPGQAEKVAVAVGKVRDAYKAIGSTTCS